MAGNVKGTNREKIYKNKITKRMDEKERVNMDEHGQRLKAKTKRMEEEEEKDNIDDECERRKRLQQVECFSVTTSFSSSHFFQLVADELKRNLNIFPIILNEHEFFS